MNGDMKGGERKTSECWSRQSTIALVRQHTMGRFFVITVNFDAAGWLEDFYYQ